MSEFSSLRYEVAGRQARITLNRPDRLNAINGAMPSEIRSGRRARQRGPGVHVIVLSGAGRSFCAGLRPEGLRRGAAGAPSATVWDPIKDYRFMKRNTDDFMSLFRSLKPTICKVQGHAVAGGSDIALCCDLVVMADDARIGYMPARVWGCPTTGMWVYRLGAEKAKRMLLTGDTIDGKQAAAWGLVLESVPADQLDGRVAELAERMAGVPTNQLAMQKLMINQAYENMGIESTQILATLFDGITRHSPEGRWFQQLAATHGFHEAVAWRDSGRSIPEGGGEVPGALPDR